MIEKKIRSNNEFYHMQYLHIVRLKIEKKNRMTIVTIDFGHGFFENLK